MDEEEKTNIDDEEEVLELIKKKDSFYALCASKRLLRSKKFALKAVAADGLALEYFTKKIRSDFDVVLEAVKQNDNALEFASQDLKGNEYIINNLIIESNINMRYSYLKIESIILHLHYMNTNLI